MAVARPVLFFGPRPSHIADLLDRHQFGLHVDHGDVDTAVRSINELRQKSDAERRAMGMTAQSVLKQQLSQDILCGRMCDGLELAFQRQSD